MHPGSDEPPPRCAAIAALFVAGVFGGIVSVLVSLVSLVTYPVLLAVGLSPVAANVTNTVSLMFTAVGAGLSWSRPGSAGKALTVEALQRRQDRVLRCPAVTSLRPGGGRWPGAG